MSENSLSETYLNGMVHIIQPGDTPEYLEDLRKRGFITVSFKIDEAVEKEYANVVVTSIDTTIDTAGLIAGMKSYLEEIAPKMSDIDSLTDEEVASFNETLKSFKDALRQAGVATYLADTTLDPRTDTGMNPETFDPRTDTSLNDLLDSYIAALDEKEAKTADTTGTTEIPADVAAEIDALPKGLVDLNKEYIAARDELIAKTGKEPNSAEVFSYMVEQAKSGKKQSETTVSPDTTVNDTTDRTITLPGGLIVKLSDVLQVTDSLSDDTNTYFYRVSDYINPETGRLEDIPIPLYVCKNSDVNDTTDTTDPNNWADGPTYSVNLYGPHEEYKFILNPGEKEPSDSDVKIILREEPETYSINLYGPHEEYKFILNPGEKEPSDSDVKIILREEPETYSINLYGPHEEYKVFLVDDEPLRMIPAADTPIAFISTKDAETEAVTSVQVACADTDGWRTVGTLNNPDGINWKWYVGNLTGSGTPSVVWHAQELGALGVWTDGTDNWTGIAGWFDANWTMLGCGDFDGDGKDSVLMSLSGGLFYSVDLDGTLTALGGLNWSGWEFGAVGDFAGDGKDDVVLFNKGLNCVVLLADGNADAWTSLGTIDSSDWAIAGAGDFDGDGIDDLLVHQDSTGLIGGYAGADMNQWSVVGNAHYLYSDTAVLA